MDTVKDLGEEDTFILHATFNPRPLLAVMKRRGFTSHAEKIERKHWKVTFVHQNRKDAFEASSDDAVEAKPDMNLERAIHAEPQTYELDNRGLEPPNPMIRTLNKLERCQPGDQVIIHNDRVPIFLLDELNTLGYTYKVEEQADGSARVFITKR